MLGALKLIREKLPAAKAKWFCRMRRLNELADKLSALRPNMEIQIGNLPQALAEADVAIASTGTVTMECAFFGVPTVTLYKTSWSTYQIARRIVNGEMADDAEHSGGRGNFSRIRPGRRHAGKLLPAPRWSFCKTNRAATKSKSGWQKLFRPWADPARRTRAATAILSLFK